MKKRILILLALAVVLLFASCDDNVYDLTVTVNWTVPAEIEALLPTDNLGNCYFEVSFGDAKPKKVYYSEPHSYVFSNISHVDRQIGVILYDPARNQIAASQFDTHVIDSDVTVDLSVSRKSNKLTINFGFNDMNGLPVTASARLFAGSSFFIGEQPLLQEESMKEKNPNKSEKLDGWYDGLGQRIENEFVMPEDDAVIYARWI